jgi:hypothetical protein
MNHKIIGDIGQWLSVLCMIVGTILMFNYHIDYGTIIFTIGCIVSVIGTKIKYYGDEYINRHNKIKEIVLYDCRNNQCDESVVDGHAGLYDMVR